MSAAAPSRNAQSWRRRLLMGVVAVVVLAADQVTKTVAENHLSKPRHVIGTLWLELTYNSGAAFSLGRGVTPVVVAVVILLIAALLAFGRSATRAARLPAIVGVGLLVGGAVGNLADRLVRHHGGAVIDFIDIAQIGRRARWPVFNVADAAIVLGAVLVSLSYSLTTRPSSSVPLRGAQAGSSDE